MTAHACWFYFPLDSVALSVSQCVKSPPCSLSKVHVFDRFFFRGVRPQHSSPLGQVPDICWMTLSECVSSLSIQQLAHQAPLPPSDIESVTWSQGIREGSNEKVEFRQTCICGCKCVQLETILVIVASIGKFDIKTLAVDCSGEEFRTIEASLHTATAT